MSLAQTSHISSPKSYISGLRTGAHAISFASMLFISAVILLSNHTLQSASVYAWFIQNWPYTDRGWGLVFLLSAWLGSIGWFYGHRYTRWIAAVSLASGHATIVHGIWVVNPVSIGIATYSVIAASSLVVIALTVLEDW